MSNKTLVFVAYGSVGDVLPLVAVAETMTANNKVVFLANEYFEKHVVQRGIPFVSIGSAEHQLSAKEGKNSSGETAEGRIHRFDNVIGKCFSKCTKVIENLRTENPHLLVVTHGNLTPASIACEKYNIPIIITYYATSQIPRNTVDYVDVSEFYENKGLLEKYIRAPLHLLSQMFAFEVKDCLNKYRAEAGLPAITNPISYWLKKTFSKNKGSIQRLSIIREIALVPEWFADPVHHQYPNIQFINFPFPSEIKDNPEELYQFIAEHGAPAVFTPGTAVEDIEAFAREIIPICRKLNCPAVLCSNLGKSIFEELPKADDVPIFFLDYANFKTLLPQSRCLFHHGGIGTLAQAIRAGIPQIIRPRMYDQPINAFRAMNHGLAGVVSPHEYAADFVVDILLRIESSPIHQERIKYYKEVVNNVNGALWCAKIISEYTGQRVEDETVNQHLEVC